MDKKFFLAAAAGFCVAGVLALALRLVASWSVLGLSGRLFFAAFAVCAVGSAVQFTLRYRKA